MANNNKVKLIVETDIFSDVDDAAALLIAAMHDKADLIGVNVNHRSAYSALAVSGILAQYGKGHVPIGIKRPLTSELFFDNLAWARGEFAAHIGYQGRKYKGFLGGDSTMQKKWPNPYLSDAERKKALETMEDPLALVEQKALDPVELYKKQLASAPDGSVVIVSIGFMDNIYDLLTNKACSHLIEKKVKELVIMGGSFGVPFIRPAWNFFPLGDKDRLKYAATVVDKWPGKITFVGNEMGCEIQVGMKFMTEGPEDDLVRKAYILYTNLEPRKTWDPQAVLYAVNGCADGLFEIANTHGRLHLQDSHGECPGKHVWIASSKPTNHRYLKLTGNPKVVGAALDELYLKLARKRLLQTIKATT